MGSRVVTEDGKSVEIFVQNSSCSKVENKEGTEDENEPQDYFIDQLLI